MKSTIKLFLVVILFSSVVFAGEGDMWNGGRTCSENCCPAAESLAEEETILQTNDDSIFVVVKEYLETVFDFVED